jgi:transcriptional regulator with XRE-family HTH domain
LKTEKLFIIVYYVEQKNNIMINRRIKELRKALNMTQVGFSQVVSLSSGYLAGIETEKRKVNDRLIKLVCSSFNASEMWLRNGEGTMFTRNSEEKYLKLAGLYRELEPRYKDYLLKEIDLLLKIQTLPPEGNYYTNSS